MKANLEYREKIYSTKGGSYINVNSVGDVGYCSMSKTMPSPSGEMWHFGRHQHWVKDGGHIYTEGLVLYVDYSTSLENV